MTDWSFNPLLLIFTILFVHRVTLNLGLTCYKDFLGTNFSPSARRIQDLGLRQCNNSQYHMADPLGKDRSNIPCKSVEVYRCCSPNIWVELIDSRGVGGVKYSYGHCRKYYLFCLVSCWLQCSCVGVHVPLITLWVCQSNSHELYSTRSHTCEYRSAIIGNQPFVNMLLLKMWIQLQVANEQQRRTLNLLFFRRGISAVDGRRIVCVDEKE